MEIKEEKKKKFGVCLIKESNGKEMWGKKDEGRDWYLQCAMSTKWALTFATFSNNFATIIF